MTKKHLQFCIYYMQVGDPLVAYKMTYPRAAVKSLPASVSRLMARPDVAEWVNGTEERVHHRMMRKFYSEHYDDFKEQLLTINQKRTILTRIITGETKRIRYVQGKYGLQKIEEPLPVYAVLRAVDLDTRLENFYNYLTRSDTWRKAQNIYVNTPTLQQQVNILINQTTEQEETKDTQEPTQIKAVTESPLQGDRGTLAHDTRQSFPLGKGTEGDALAPDSPEEQTTNPPLGGARGAHTPEEQMTNPPLGGDRGAHTPEEQTTNPPLGGDRGAHTPEQNLSPAACPDRFGNGGNPARAGAGVEHARRTPAQGTRETENPNPPAQHLPSGPGQPPSPDTGEPEIPSPPGRGVYGHSAEGGWVHSRREIPPCKEVPHEHGAEDVHSRRTDNTSPHPGDLGVTSRRATKTPRYLKTGHVPHNAGLTKLNKMHVPALADNSGKTPPGFSQPLRESS